MGLGKMRGPLRTQALPPNTLALVSHLPQLTRAIRCILFIRLFSELSTLELLTLKCQLPQGLWSLL